MFVIGGRSRGGGGEIARSLDEWDWEMRGVV